ncbi:MAG: restriction endonuclease subunit S, partial [Clostridia bacterium]|nr:restriction endonuclease subunit S [Clostridia bacterium]
RQTDRQTERIALIKLCQYVFGFAIVLLDDVIISLNTGLNPRQFFKLNTDDAENYYITIREIVGGKIVTTDKTDRMNDEALRLCNNRSNLEAGDVLFSGTGTIGETAVIEETPRNWNIKEGVYTIKPNPTLLDSKFLRYLLMTQSMKDAYMRKAAGGTVQSVPMREVRLLPIPLPSLLRQKELASTVERFDKLCNDIADGLPAEIEARRQQYEYYRDKLLTFQEQ